MNKEQITHWLKTLLGDVLHHDKLFDELVSLVCGSGSEKSFLALFVSRLTVLSGHGVHASDYHEFENLGGGLFSMHLSQSAFNIRILYGFLPNGVPVLLRAFYEREGKNKTNYIPHMKLAKERLDSMRRDCENERYKI